MIITNEQRFLIIGGTGFIGQAVTKKILGNTKINDKICIFSRSESNQHVVRTKFAKFQDRISFFIGDIRDKESIRKCIKSYRPNVIIVSAALKRIDVCEEHPIEALKTNTRGLENVCSLAVEEDSVTHILYTSTDKASDPVNVYGNTKALGEKIMLNYAKISPKRFCVTRYGNVLDSTGSVIPIFKNLIEQRQPITLRGNSVTRFILNETQACNTVWDSLFFKEGPILIPKCKSMYVRDLAEVMIEDSESRIKINIIDPLPFEKEHETLISSNEWKYLREEDDQYYQLDPSLYKENKTGEEYISNCNVLSKVELKEFLRTNRTL